MIPFNEAENHTVHQSADMFEGTMHNTLDLSM